MREQRPCVSEEKKASNNSGSGRRRLTCGDANTNSLWQYDAASSTSPASRAAIHPATAAIAGSASSPRRFCGCAGWQSRRWRPPRRSQAVTLGCPLTAASAAALTAALRLMDRDARATNRTSSDGAAAPPPRSREERVAAVNRRRQPRQCAPPPPPPPPRASCSRDNL